MKVVTFFNLECFILFSDKEVVAQRGSVTGSQPGRTDLGFKLLEYLCKK